jgi:hypothetical protein
MDEDGGRVPGNCFAKPAGNVSTLSTGMIFVGNSHVSESDAHVKWLQSEYLMRHQTREVNTAQRG